MIPRSLRILSAGLLFAVAVTAQAQGQGDERSKWYLAAGAGANWTDDLTFSGATVGNVSFGTGYTGNVSIGRYMDDVRVIRLELEGVAAKTDFNNSVGFKTSGDMTNAGLMFNFIYDIRTNSPWTPYLGGGIGWSRVWMNNLQDVATGTTFIDSHDDVFAYQFKGGVAYEFSESWALTIGYRYFATDNMSFQGTAAAPGVAKTGGIRSNNFELGFKWDF